MLHCSRGIKNKKNSISRSGNNDEMREISGDASVRLPLECSVNETENLPTVEIWVSPEQLNSL